MTNRARRAGYFLVALLLSLSGMSGHTNPPSDKSRDTVQSGTIPRAAVRPRVIVLTDIGNEPDDAQSLIRFLLYSTDYDVEGILASTSRHQRDRVMPELIKERIDAYEAVYRNLKIHDPAFPEPERLKKRVGACQPGYGMDAVGEAWGSEGARSIIESLKSTDSRPLWVLAWGGTNCLAQALWQLSQKLPPSEIDKLVDRLRVYAISDQDDAGPWLRHQYPNLEYIVSPIENMFDYAHATWRGLSGDHSWPGSSSNEVFCYIKQRMGFSCDDPEGGPDFDLVDNPWLDSYIRRGPLGSLYPWTLYAMEGDSPSFMNLINNGLNAHHSPGWGGWGGRYALAKPLGEPRMIWTDDADRVIDSRGVSHETNHATIWRWREAYQWDFAARMAWTVTSSFEDANHPPVIGIDGDDSGRPVHFRVDAGEQLDIPLTVHDPDGDAVSLSAWQYHEAGTNSSSVHIRWNNKLSLHLSVPADAPRGTMHLIIEGFDDGEPSITRYRRIILAVQ